jgi:hypothetical protein
MESGAIIENIAILIILVLIIYCLHNRDRPMEMNESDKKFVAYLDSIPLERARRELASGAFGSVGSPKQYFASSWLAVKEAEARDERESRIESISRKALRIAIIAIVLSTITAIAIAVITVKCSI